MYTVSFKCEMLGEGQQQVGPVTVVDHDLYDADPVIAKARASGQIGIPFGYVPAGQTDRGWMTRERALAIAAAHGVTLTEW